MKKIIAVMLAMTLTFGFALTVFAGDETISVDTEADSGDEGGSSGVVIDIVENKAFLALGQDLTQEQLKKVLDMMDVSIENLGNYNVTYITNADERSYLGGYLDNALIGSKSLSSVLVRPASTGHGVNVITNNINFVTEQMYQNALITAGVTDADVIVAAPTPISGTAALIGALKAYSAMTGMEVSEKAIDTAIDELVTTGSVVNAIGDDAAALELISYIKAQIAANDLNTKEEIEAAVRKGNEDLNANLAEEDIQKIIDTMIKIKDMGIDFDILADQAEEIYAKYGDEIRAGTFNIDDVSLSDLGVGKIVKNAVGNFFKKITTSVKDFFVSLFSF